MDLSDIVVHLGLLCYIFEKPFFHIPRTALITKRSSAADMTAVCNGVTQFIASMCKTIQSSTESLFQDIVQDKSVAYSLTEVNLIDGLVDNVRAEARKQQLVFHSMSYTDLA